MKRFLWYGILGVVVLLVPVVGYYFIKSAPSAPETAVLPVGGALPVTASPLLETPTTTKSGLPLYTYIETVDGCGPYYQGDCVNLRSGPGTTYPAVIKLRNGMVFKVASTTVTGGQTWYEIGFDGEIRYPERVTGPWYVSAQYVHPFLDPGVLMTNAGVNASSTKRIIVSLSKQMLYAYAGNELFMEAPVSTGLNATPTPVGNFWVYRKIPDSYMQGPIRGFSDQYYDLPGVPWDLYFTKDGDAIHGTYWHTHFGQQWSHGCVNLAPDPAKKLYEWAPLGTPVIVEQ